MRQLFCLRATGQRFLLICQEANEKVLLLWLSTFKGIEPSLLNDCHYSYVDTQAVRHMIKVASGLDSMVLGEPQILGQMKSAYAQALEAGTVNGMLGFAMQHTFSYAKKIRSQTGIGENPVSVAYAAIALSQRIFSDLSKVKVLLVGAGETIELVARHFTVKGIDAMYVASRTLKRAEPLAEKYQGKAITLSEIGEYLPHVDIVVSSTASQLPLLGKGLIERAMAKRRHQPMFMVDIAVPRDIEPEVAKLNDVYLYTVDDLSDVVAQNRQTRLQEVEKADVIIAQALDHYANEQRKNHVVPAIKAYRQHAEFIRDATLEKALQQLATGEQAEQVLTNMARLLTNRLIHKPSHNVKKAAEMDDHQAIENFSALFDLSFTDKSDDSDGIL